MTRKPRPNPYRIELTPAERAVIEAERVRLGLRDHASVVRGWIDTARQQHQYAATKAALAPYMEHDR